MSHGRNRDMLYFAELIGDTEKIVQYWIQEKDWTKVLAVLNKQASMELYYKFSTLLLENAPTDTINYWIKQPNLNPRHLLPALMKYEISNVSSVDKATRIVRIIYLVYRMY